MFNHENFIAEEKALLIAPAGFGKTHAIVDCLRHTRGKQLILTHTNAGVAAIREKLTRSRVPAANYSVETITSFAQRIAYAFYRGEDFPDQEAEGFYEFTVAHATAFVTLKPVQDVIRATYNGLFADEHQDCTLETHKLILALSSLFPTRLLGDHLQGIFDFGKGTLVDLRDEEHMAGFLNKQWALDEPWRWKNVGNERLGKAIIAIRKNLEENVKIDLSEFSGALELCLVKKEEMYVPGSNYNNAIRDLLSGQESILFIHPQSHNKNARKNFVSRFANRATMLESVDSEEFYTLSRLADTMGEAELGSLLCEMANTLFGKTGINRWLNGKGFKRKKDTEEVARLEPAIVHMNVFAAKRTPKNLKGLLKSVYALPDMRCHRKEIMRSLLRALDLAESEGKSVYEAMKKERNLTRRVGRKIIGRCIGTTLLTKGLEFDTVAILGASEFTNNKHLYVAFTRATKRLIVFSEKKEISFE